MKSQPSVISGIIKIAVGIAAREDGRPFTIFCISSGETTLPCRSRISKSENLDKVVEKKSEDEQTKEKGTEVEDKDRRKKAGNREQKAVNFTYLWGIDTQPIVCDSTGPIVSYSSCFTYIPTLATMGPNCV
jgi:hypothetical protein